MMPVMIFAAGFGSRMRPLTDDRPKPLIPLGGRSLLDRALDMVAEAGFGPVVINAHYLAEQIEAVGAARGIPVVTERPDILETGGGLKNALPLLGAGPVATVNPDVLWQGPNPLTLLGAAWRPEMEALLACVPRAATHGHAGPGDFDLDGARLVRRTGATAALVYAGCQILQTGPVAAWPETAFSLNRVWTAMAARGGVFGAVHPGPWADVGSPAGLAAAEALL